MNVYVVLAHPGSHSLNHAIARTVVDQLRRNGHQVVFHDLYDEHFDPILTDGEITGRTPLPPEIERHSQEVAAAEGFVVIHPNWWGQPPAILKGWIDRVLRDGVAYQFVEMPGSPPGIGTPRGMLKAKVAVVFNTGNTPRDREIREFGDPLEQIWGPDIFQFCEIKTFHRESFTGVITASEDQRRQWLLAVQEIVDRYFPRIGSTGTSLNRPPF